MAFKSEYMSVRAATDLLIKEVAKRPVLWHQNHVKQLHLKSQAWNEVAQILNIPEEAIRTKWKNLRGIWTKEHGKLKLIKNYKPCWKHYQVLRFLEEMNNPETSTNDTTDYDLEENGDVEALDSDITDEDLIQEDSLPHNSTEIRDFKEELFDKEDNANMCFDEVAHNRKIIQLKTRKRAKRGNDDDDEDGEYDTEYDFLFLKSLLPYFKMLDPMRRLTVRSKIQDILMKELSLKGNIKFKDYLS